MVGLAPSVSFAFALAYIHMNIGSVFLTTTDIGMVFFAPGVTDNSITLVTLYIGYVGI